MIQASQRQGADHKNQQNHYFKYCFDLTHALPDCIDLMSSTAVSPDAS